MSGENTIPVVMAIGGLDPSGGAGLVADVQTLAHFGCHASTVITATTVQDTTGVKSFQPVSAGLVQEQMAVVFDDMRPQVVKTGMLVNAEIVEAVAAVLQKFPDTLLVVDPVLSSNMDESLSEYSLIDAIRNHLLPRATLILPNIPEVKALSKIDAANDVCANELAMCDCLVTGSHENTPDVINTFYRHGKFEKKWKWPRLEHEFHGSGCTLAAAVAAALAHGKELITAIDIAQQYVYSSLVSAIHPGAGQHIPYRVAAEKP